VFLARSPRNSRRRARNEICPIFWRFDPTSDELNDRSRRATRVPGTRDESTAGGPRESDVEHNDEFMERMAATIKALKAGWPVGADPSPFDADGEIQERRRTQVRGAVLRRSSDDRTKPVAAVDA